MVTWIWVNIASGNGLLPDSTRPLPETMLTDRQYEVFWYSPEDIGMLFTLDMSLKIANLLLQPHLLGTN